MITIDQIEATLIELPTIRQHVLSMATMTSQSIVLVRLRCSDGSEGIGEGTTIGGMSYGEESVESIKLAIDTYIAPILKGLDANAVTAAMQTVGQSVKGANIAKCAVETALQDAKARRLGVPLSDLFGGMVRDRVEVAWTLASGRAESDIDEAERMLGERRHRIFKLKIGKRRVRDDIAHVAAIKKAVGDRASVRVDVNQAWSLSDAAWGLSGLEDAGVDLVEQPVARERLNALAQFTRDYRIAVMADEALRGPTDAFGIAAAHGADVFALKIAQSGGVGPAAQVAAIAEAAGIGLYGGTMIETGVATAASAQLFATLPALGWGTELFGPLLFTENVTTPLEYRDFGLVVPRAPGIGVDLDDDKVAFFRRDRTRSTPVQVTPIAGA